ncbi:MAG: Os1348 family NHLP clan protein [Planctomycetota bacterium]|jgi:hypothetical protein
MIPHEISNGIEQVLAMAAVDEKFASTLLDNREAAAKASGVELTPTEKQILLSIEKDALKQMIENVRGRIPAKERRAFLKKSAAALLALVGAGFLTIASGCNEIASTGAQPDRPKPKPEPPSDLKTRGIRSDRPRTQGIQPDRPEGK